MRFLVDAQLPRRLACRLHEAGYDTVHTLDLPDRNRTSDEKINELSSRELRVAITKDTDFVNSFLLSGKPYKLLLITTGNISNVDLEKIFVAQIQMIAEAFESYEYLELTRTAPIFHS